MQKVFGMAIETPSEVADVFVNFSPHTDQIYTSVFKGGWTDRRPDWSEWTDDTDMTGLPQRLGAYLNSLQNPQPHPHDECLATRADDKAFVRP